MEPVIVNMSAPQQSSSNPRRRPTKAHASLSTHAMSLRKSGTFHSPPALSTDICGLENQPFMPRRSPTSPESLEALLAQQDSSVRRIVDVLKDFDAKISGVTSSSSILADPEVLPVPSFVLDSASFDGTPMDIDAKPSAVERNPHDHASDSGLGTSIGSKYGKDITQLPGLEAPPSNVLKDEIRAERFSVRESLNTSISSTHSAVTRGFPSRGASEEKHTLGDFACRQIHDSIIKPILAEETLKDFHPLIKDVPRRIGEKSICNLRDLEKTLIFLAPVSGIRYLSDSAKVNCISLGFKELSATAASYQRFCERSIQLLHATVGRLSEPDQRLPTDRPYTTNYFLDLIEQIRRYAAIMAATRQKESKGEDMDEMDYSRYDRAAAFLFTRTNQAINSDEKITLRGGLSHNGRPMELVREKNGKAIPIAEEAENGYKVSKRALSDDEMDEDEVTRSMARRRKSEKPGDVMHTCRDCKKEFKRPCDLTKHEKTHSRPWKCSELKCKYYDLGWPTEKERDRHMNDKHSAAPAQYKCLYPPCTYASKRESNCKQHMEKAHGWEYVRSKSNGRKKALTNDSPTTPLTPFLGTPMSANLTTPVTPFIPSPQVAMIDTFGDYYGFGTPAMSVQGYQQEYRRDSMTTDGSAFTYSSGHSPLEPNSFIDAVTPEEAAINHFDFSNTGCFTSGFQQQPTPASTFDPLPFQTTLAQPDVTLFSPDEGFSEMDMGLHSFNGPPAEDFTLFDGVNQQGDMPLNHTANFFPDFNQLGGQFDYFFGQQ